jgi:glucans biosynthesis protein
MTKILFAILLALAALTTVRAAERYPFSLDTLLEDAKKLAASPYAPQRSNVPGWLEKLSPEQYRSIRFNPQSDIWTSEGLPFRIEMLPVGFNFNTTVAVSIVQDGQAQDLVATTLMFILSSSIPTPPTGTVVPLSGFRIRNQINSSKTWDEFLVFQGASYFRAVAQHQLYGLSARGLAINTAEPSGEEFPVFTHFWIEQPGAKATDLVIYALLESASATGAYRFTVRPGAQTTMDVDMTLFPRADLHLVGVAPLTSMFLFDETNRGKLDDYRPEVHDSDGFEVLTKSGEHIWRPLANPATLQISTFTTQVPQGFGLMQRSRDPSDFQDLDAHYERRPSLWVEPRSEWSAGSVELVEIPSGRETNDNIVAFWRPSAVFPAGHPMHFSYHLIWEGDTKFPKNLGKTLSTRSGASLDGKRRVFEIDIVGAGEKPDGLRLDLSSSGGKISNPMLISNPNMHGLRASFELDPSNKDLVELRLRIMRNQQPVSETWLYRWTAS